MFSTTFLSPSEVFPGRVDRHTHSHSHTFCAHAAFPVRCIASLARAASSSFIQHLSSLLHLLPCVFSSCSFLPLSRLFPTLYFSLSSWLVSHHCPTISILVLVPAFLSPSLLPVSLPSSCSPLSPTPSRATSHDRLSPFPISLSLPLKIICKAVYEQTSSRTPDITLLPPKREGLREPSPINCRIDIYPLYLSSGRAPPRPSPSPFLLSLFSHSLSLARSCFLPRVRAGGARTPFLCSGVSSCTLHVPGLCIVIATTPYLACSYTPPSPPPEYILCR